MRRRCYLRTHNGQCLGRGPTAGARSNPDRIGAPSPHLRCCSPPCSRILRGRARSRSAGEAAHQPEEATPMKSWIARTLAIGAIALLAAACSPQDVKSYYESIGLHISDADANEAAANA